MEANLEIRKQNLINWMSNLRDESILIHLEQVKQKGLDWWDIISSEEKSAIDEGISQLDNGDFITQSEMRSGIKQRYGF